MRAVEFAGLTMTVRTGRNILQAENDDTFLLKPSPQIQVGPPRVTRRLMEAILLGGERLMTQIDKENPSNLEDYKERLQSLVDSIDSVYPPFKGRGFGQIKLYRRMWPTLLLYLALKEPIYLFALSMDGPAIVDTYAVLERFASQSVLKRLSAKKPASRALSKMIEQASLPDLAAVLLEWKIWNEMDVTFARRLTRIRNGIAHRNRQTISKLLFSGKKITPFDIPRIAMRVDTRSIILTTLRLVVKITESFVPQKYRNPQTRKSSTKRLRMRAKR